MLRWSFCIIESGPKTKTVFLGGANTWPPNDQFFFWLAAAAVTLTIVFVGVCALPTGIWRNPINLHTDERVESFVGARAW